MEQIKENDKITELLKNLSNIILIVITDVLHKFKIYPEYVFETRSFYNIPIVDAK
jgi:hypothetical protein